MGLSISRSESSAPSRLVSHEKGQLLLDLITVFVLRWANEFTSVSG